MDGARWLRGLAYAGIVAWFVLASGTARAQSPESSDLAKASQNPVGNLVSLPFQNNTSFGIGPNDAISNVLNIQPVYPVGLGKKWNLINRGIVPVIYREEVLPALEMGDAFGLGDISYTGFISPAKPGKLIWGVGPSFLLPTATYSTPRPAVAHQTPQQAIDRLLHQFAFQIPQGQVDGALGAGGNAHGTVSFGGAPHHVVEVLGGKTVAAFQ